MRLRFKRSSPAALNGAELTVDRTSLDRFIEAQTMNYPAALAEIASGRKRSHWMWYVFPQIAGLGRSATAQHFAIRSLKEAGEYLNHPVLGHRYVECVMALQDLRGSDPVAVFGHIDVIKLRSSLTLFEAAGSNSLFGAALDRWFAGARDPVTVRILGDS